MKKFMFMLLCAAVLATACNNKGEDAAANRSLKATPQTLTFAAADASTGRITITAENTDWNYETGEEWVSASREENVLLVSVAENTAEVARESVITITATETGVEPVSVKVKQQAAAPVSDEPSLALSETSLRFAAVNAAAQEVKVLTTGGVEWETLVEDEWVKIARNGDTLSVSVEDNDASRARESYVTVHPADDSDVRLVRLNIYQEPLEVEASLTVINLPENNEINYRHFEDGSIQNNLPIELGYPTIKIEPQTSTCTIKLVSGGDWLDVNGYSNRGDNEEYGINDAELKIYTKNIGLPEEAKDAEILLIHDDDPSITVTIKLHKSAMIRVDSSSNISGDIEMNDMPNVNGRITTYGSVMNIQRSDVRLTFFTDGVTFYSSSQYTEDHILYDYSGKGEIVQMTLYDAPKIEEVTPGTYTVSSEAVTGNAAAGSSAYSMKRIQLKECYYARIDNNIEEDVEFAVLTSGSVTFADNEDGTYTVTWSLGSDNGYTVSGSYTGAIDFEKKTTGMDGGMGGFQPV